MPRLSFPQPNLFLICFCSLWNCFRQTLTILSWSFSLSLLSNRVCLFCFWFYFGRFLHHLSFFILDFSKFGSDFKFLWVLIWSFFLHSNLSHGWDIVCVFLKFYFSSLHYLYFLWSHFYYCLFDVNGYPWMFGGP